LREIEGHAENFLSLEEDAIARVLRHEADA
jgi:hypothetical protein